MACLCCHGPSRQHRDLYSELAAECSVLNTESLILDCIVIVRIRSLGPAGRQQRSVFGTESRTTVGPHGENQNFRYKLFGWLVVLSLDTQLPC